MEWLFLLLFCLFLLRFFLTLGFQNIFQLLLPRFLSQPRLIAAFEIHNSALFQHPDPVGKTVDKITVMGHKQQRTLKLFHR